jgi:hypothetical protein
MTLADLQLEALLETARGRGTHGVQQAASKAGLAYVALNLWFP